MRAVPRRDPGGHPERLAQRERERPRGGGPDDLHSQQVSPVGGLAEQPGGGEHLEAGERACAAGLGGKQGDDLLPPPRHDVGGAQERPARGLTPGCAGVWTSGNGHRLAGGDLLCRKS